MITNTQIKARLVPKIRRVRAMGKDVFVHWCGQEHKIQVASDLDGIIFNAGNSRISINANFLAHELGRNATMLDVESCFSVRAQPETLADYD